MSQTPRSRRAPSHRLFAMAALLVCAGTALAQMPPHPELVRRIARQEIEMPYVLRHQEELRALGIDAPWSEQRGDQTQRVRPGATQRILGPAASPSGTWRALVLLVKFSDKSSSTDPVFFDNLVFGTGSNTVRDYFSKVSYGNIDVVTVNLPSSIGWTTAPQTYAYYCGSGQGTGTYPQNSQKLTEDIVALVNGSVNFAQYDNDGNGEVDALFIVHTGPGAEYTGSNNDIWSHAWSVHNYTVLDGVRINRYSIEPEYWSTPGDMTCGVYAHELGHAGFGLPDLYDTDGSSEGLGRWSLMASGSWNGEVGLGESPSLPDPWCHIQMGFVSPTVVTENVVNQHIPAMATTPTFFRLWTNGTIGQQYFLVQNRQLTGYDSFLPGSGLLIFHVDENVATGNTKEWYPGNTSNGHYKVAVEQADNLYQLEKKTNRGNSGDPFPGSTNKTAFTASSSPNSNSYAGSATQVAVQNISASASVMTADLLVAPQQLVLTAPDGGEVWASGRQRQIAWNSSGVSGTVSIDYTTNNGSTWVPVTSTPAIPSAPRSDERPRPAGTAGGAMSTTGLTQGSYSWTIPNTPSVQCKVRVTSDATPSLTDASNAFFTIVGSLPLTLRVFLEGPWDQGTSLMSTNLRTSGILEAHFSGATIPVDATDSIDLEIRNAASAGAATIRRHTPAWVLADGTVVNFTNPGVNPVAFDSLQAGSFYLVVNHRNHLSVMSASTIAMTVSGVTYDFTDWNGGAKAYGTDPRKNLNETVYGMWAGDAMHDGVVNALDRRGAWNDRDATGYVGSDLDLSGTVGNDDGSLAWANRNRFSKVP